jgi:RimJ/RimL family protein N-acetyltransferase
VAVLFNDDIIDSNTPALSQLINIFKTSNAPVIALKSMEKDKIPVGWIGFKFTHEGADIYNCILGDQRLKRQGIMSEALQIMCALIYTRGVRQIFLKVLRTNGAAEKWYLKNKFQKAASYKQYDLLRLIPGVFSDIKLEIQAGEGVR